MPCSVQGRVRCEVQPVLRAVGAGSITSLQASLLGLTMLRHDAGSCLIMDDTKLLHGAIRLRPRSEAVSATGCLLRAEEC